MSLLILLGLWVIGWQFARYVVDADRALWAFPVGVLATSVSFQVLWFLGMPFAWLAMGWWFLAGISGAALWFDSRRYISRFLVRRHLQSWIERVSTTQVGWQHWPLIFMGFIAAFSVALILIWSLIVRPVGWDHLTLYEGRAQLISQGARLGSFLDEFARVENATGYDFLHPFGSSLFSALFHWSGSEFALAWQGVFLVNIVLIAWRQLQTWPARIVLAFFVVTSRGFFEHALEGYPSWIAALLWLLLATQLPSLKDHISRKHIWRVALIVCSIGAWRVAEPFFLLFAGSVIAWMTYRRWRGEFAWEWILSLLPAGIVMGQWSMIMRWGREASAFAAQSHAATLLAHHSRHDLGAVVLIGAFPLWKLILLTICVMLVVKPSRDWWRRNAWLLFLTLSFVALVLAAPIAQAVLTAFPHSEILAIWPRLVLAPGLLLVWCLTLVCDVATTPPPGKKSGMLQP